MVRKIEERDFISQSHCILQNCGQIFRYSIATGRAELNPTPHLKGALKTKPVNHFMHLFSDDLPEFLQKLDAFKGNPRTQLALKLMQLTFVRTNELREATWKNSTLKKESGGFLQSE